MIDVNEIDFVLPWVDGSDPEWRSQFNLYSQDLKGDKRYFSESRFRSWDNLRYLFRSFEKYLPWVRKIHFVTWGHLPSWLDVSHEKINIVRHDEFIGQSCLPIFNSHPIEINMHKISGLAEKFVYFNDDTFVLKGLSKDFFFKNGLPRDTFAFNAISNSMIAHVKINNIQVINRHFEKFEVVKRNFFNIFNYRANFLEVIKTVLLMPWPKITGFYDPHLPQAFLKTTFHELWENESGILRETSMSKIRNSDDVNQYLFRYWHLCKGEFVPGSFRRNHVQWVRNYEDAVTFHNKIISGKYRMACINDGVLDEASFSKIKDKINEAFDHLLPDKSSFEK